MLGPVAIRRLIRFGALALATLSSTKTDPTDLDGETALLLRAQTFEDFMDGATICDAPEGEAS